MAMPKIARTARNSENVFTNPVLKEKMPMRHKLTTSVHLRPNRSARIPKMTAPRERKRRVKVKAL